MAPILKVPSEINKNINTPAVINVLTEIVIPCHTILFTEVTRTTDVFFMSVVFLRLGHGHMKC